MLIHVTRCDWSDEPLGEGGAISFTVCTRSFDGLSACGANGTVFYDHHTGRKVCGRLVHSHLCSLLVTAAGMYDSRGERSREAR